MEAYIQKAKVMHVTIQKQPQTPEAVLTQQIPTRQPHLRQAR